MTIYLSPARFLDSSERRAIQEKRWAVDCFEMKLFQGGTDQLRYSGPGSIRYNTEGQLEYVLYDTQYREDATSAVETMFGGGDPPVGAFLEPHHFFRLEAQAYNGRTWNAERVDAATDTFEGAPGARVHGEIDVLVGEPDVKGPAEGAWLWAACDVDVPANAATEVATTVAGVESRSVSRNAWTFNTDFGRFTVTTRDGGLQVQLVSTGLPMPPDLPLRLEEAFSFALSRRVQWLVEETASDRRGRIVVRSLNANPIATPRVGPPVRVSDETAASALGLLVEAFLKHTTAEHRPVGERHPLAVNVLSIVRGSQSVLEDEALTLSVEIESLVTRSFANEGAVSNDVKQDVKSLMKHVKEWQRNIEIRDRALNAIGKMKAPDASNIAKDLMGKGWIGHHHWNEWRNVRNKFAHGNKVVEDYRGLVRSCRILHQMFLFLVAKAIDYQGMVTDYTATNWPLVAVPTGSITVVTQPSGSDFDPTSGPCRGGEVT